jgi:hypothetical protein
MPAELSNREGGREGGRHRISDELRKITAPLHLDMRHRRVHKQATLNSRQLTLNRCGYSAFGKHLATHLGVELTVDLTGHHVWVREGIGKEGGDRRRREETGGGGRRQEEEGGDRRRREETGGGLISHNENQKDNNRELLWITIRI